MASDTTGLNKRFFDKDAETYDQKHAETLAEILRRMRGAKDFLAADWVNDEDVEAEEPSAPRRVVRFLDYACGTGSMTRALAPFTTQCVGIDLSEGMVFAYNKRAREQGLIGDEMMAYQGNLCKPDEEPEAFVGPKFHNFDIAGVGLGFHHFDDPDLAAKRLVKRLKKGGVFFILDFFSHDPPTTSTDDSKRNNTGDAYQHGHDHHQNHGHSHSHGEDDEKLDSTRTIAHHGFSEENIKKIFEDAGAGGDFAVETFGDVKMRGSAFGKRVVFLARGTKV